MTKQSEPETDPALLRDLLRSPSVQAALRAEAARRAGTGLEEEDAVLVDEPVASPRQAPSTPSPGQLVLTQRTSLRRATPRAGGVDPVTVYLSRYVSRNSRLAIASSLRVAARIILGREGDPHEVPWEQVQYAHVQEFRAQLAREGYSWASVNRHLLAVRGVMKECWRLGLVSQEVYTHIAGVESMRSTKREVGRALKAPELQALLRACGDTTAGKRDRVIITLAAFAGMRRAEICSLQVENWDASSRKLSILGKGNKWRTVYLNAQRADVLESWLAVRGHHAGPFVQPVRQDGAVATGQHLTSTGLYVPLQRLAKVAGLKEFTPHDLRRTFITRLLKQGVDALTVSKLAGHESVQTTMLYDKRGEGAKVDAAELLSDED